MASMGVELPVATTGWGTRGGGEQALRKNCSVCVAGGAGSAAGLWGGAGGWLK